MVLLFFALDDHVVDIYFHISPYLILEHLVHKALVGGSSVLKAKRHDFVTVNVVWTWSSSAMGI